MLNYIFNYLPLLILTNLTKNKYLSILDILKILLACKDPIRKLNVDLVFFTLISKNI